MQPNPDLRQSPDLMAWTSWRLWSRLLLETEPYALIASGLVLSEEFILNPKLFVEFGLDD